MVKRALLITMAIVMLATGCAAEPEAPPRRTPTVTKSVPPLSTPTTVSTPFPTPEPTAFSYGRFELAPDAVLPGAALPSYPSSIIKTGGNTYNMEAMAAALLGGDAAPYNGAYAKGGRTVYQLGGAVCLFNSGLSAQGALGQTRAEALTAVKTTLDEMGVIAPSLYRDYEAVHMPQRDPANARWFTTDEIRVKERGQWSHTFTIPHFYTNGACILGEGLEVMLVEGGVGYMSVTVSAFAASGGLIAPPRYTDIMKALWSDEAVYVSAVTLVYSDRLTDDGTYTLCWLIEGAPHSYIYDCVLNKAWQF